MWSRCAQRVVERCAQRVVERCAQRVVYRGVECDCDCAVYQFRSKTANRWRSECKCGCVPMSIRGLLIVLVCAVQISLVPARHTGRDVW